MKPTRPVKFKGYRLPDPLVGGGKFTEAHVAVNGGLLPPCFHLRNHSPDGFEWGYGGSGPAQLALAMLSFLYGDEVALRYYMDFKFKVIAALPYDGWDMDSDQIDKIMKGITGQVFKSTL